MKQKTAVFLVVCCVCVLLFGCSSSEVQSKSTSKMILKTSDSSGDSAASSEAGDRIDVDLTKLSSTMIYSEVYNMMNTPNDYVGKTVKMKGQFATYHNDTSGEDYFAVVIADATACCQQGMEFVLGNGAVYPDDYPQKETEITVKGIFQTYKEGEYLYCHLINAELE